MFNIIQFLIKLPITILIWLCLFLCYPLIIIFMMIVSKSYEDFKKDIKEFHNVIIYGKKEK